MEKLRTGKSLTYEEIGERMDISPQQVHKIEKEAFNKIIKRFMISSGKNIFDTVLFVCEYLGIDPDQCFKKLDKENYETLCIYVEETYEKKIKGFKRSENPFEGLFK